MGESNHSEGRRMTAQEFSMLLAVTVSCVLCVGFMVFCTISWFRLESKMDFLRETYKGIRDEMDSLRQRVKEKENE